MIESALLAFISILLGILAFLAKDAYTNLMKKIDTNTRYTQKNTLSILDLKTDISGGNYILSEKILESIKLGEINKKMLEINRENLDLLIKDIRKNVAGNEKELDKYGKVIKVLIEDYYSRKKK